MIRATTLWSAVAIAAGAVATPLMGQTGDGAPPAGWSVRTDGNEDPKGVKFVAMGKGYHLTLGPAAILYRTSHDGRGPFHTVATFTQTKAPQHPEGYGLFYGGKDLAGANQHYTYFLVRGDGKYLIKRRDGDKTVTLVPWTEHAAVKQADAQGRATNRLEIEAKRDAAKVAFMVNGQVVHSMDAAAAQTDGVVGIRANHTLDLHIEGFDVHR